MTTCTGKGVVTWTVYGELPRDLVASNTEADSSRKKAYFIEASVEDNTSDGSGGGGATMNLIKSSKREYIHPMGCRDFACTYGYECSYTDLRSNRTRCAAISERIYEFSLE